MKFYDRNITKKIKEINETFPVLVLTGPRQVGKSTILKKAAETDKKRRYISLDNLTVRAFAKNESELFIQRYAPPVIIDEIQYAPELFTYIKEYVDQKKQNGAFWLTGSQTYHLMESITESLAGRAGIIKMNGLSNSEINKTLLPPFTNDLKKIFRRANVTKEQNLKQVFNRIFKGSYPRLYEIDGINLENYYDSYLETYISRDVKQLSQVADEVQFLKFINVVAVRTSSMVNYETLAQETGISAPTAKKWLSLLVSSGLILLVQPYSNNALKRVVKTPKMYFLDTGLCANIIRIQSSELLEKSAFSGAFFETYVISEIYKSYINNGIRPSMYYYRDQKKREIDCILYQNNTLYPIEIKKSANPTNATKYFYILDSVKNNEDENSVKPDIGLGLVISLNKTASPYNDRAWQIPAWII